MFAIFNVSFVDIFSLKCWPLFDIVVMRSKHGHINSFHLGT